MADSLVSLNARTAARSASGPSTAVASTTRAAGFDNESSVAPTAAIIGCVDAAPEQRGRRALVADQRLDQQRVPATRGRQVARPVDGTPGLPLARELGGLQPGQRVQVDDGGAGLAAEAGHALGGAGGRVGARRGQHQERHVLVVEPEHEVA